MTFEDGTRFDASFCFPFSKPFTGDISRDFHRSAEGEFSCSSVTHANEIREWIDNSFANECKQLIESAPKFGFAGLDIPFVKQLMNCDYLSMEKFSCLLACIPGHTPWQCVPSVGVMEGNKFVWKNATFHQVYNMRVTGLCLMKRLRVELS